MARKKRSMSLDADVCDVQKEWEEALCPICMEHPHNAVLLLCTSHAKGCRSYICDTSYRHSNCLDRFRKLNEDSNINSLNTAPVPSNTQGSSVVSDYETPAFVNELTVVHGSHNRGNRIVPTRRSSNSVDAAPVPSNIQGSSIVSDYETPAFVNELTEVHGSHHGGNRIALTRSLSNSADYDIEQEAIGRQNVESLRNDLEQEKLVKKSSLKCPLCRGDVLGWAVVEDARKHLNFKVRSCTRESCTFVGNYRELRRHARRDHPRIRPAEVDPSRQQAWTRFEHQREHDDIVSAIRSAMPGAIVFGDYVVDYNERSVERERTPSDSGGRLFTTLVLFQMLGSMRNMAGSRTRSRPWTRHRRQSGGSSRQRYLWGENLLGLQDEEGGGDGDDSFTDDEETNAHADEQAASSGPRQRRRLTRSGTRRDRL